MRPDDDLERIVQDDLDRNVAEDCVILMNQGTFHGHQGVMQLAQMLGEELPEHRGFQYTYTAVEGRMAFLEWAYDDAPGRGDRRRRLLPDRGRQDRRPDHPLHRPAETASQLARRSPRWF